MTVSPKCRAGQSARRASHHEAGQSAESNHQIYSATARGEFLLSLMSRKSANSLTKGPKIACKRSFSSFTNENTLQDYEADNVFGFMDDSDKVGQKELPIDNFPVHDLTENPTYLMEFGFGNGFVWNEEVLLVITH